MRRNGIKIRSRVARIVSDPRSLVLHITFEARITSAVLLLLARGGKESACIPSLANDSSRVLCCSVSKASRAGIMCSADSAREAEDPPGSPMESGSNEALDREGGKNEKGQTDGPVRKGANNRRKKGRYRRRLSYRSRSGGSKGCCRIRIHNSDMKYSCHLAGCVAFAPLRRRGA